LPFGGNLVNDSAARTADLATSSNAGRMRRVRVCSRTCFHLCTPSFFGAIAALGIWSVDQKRLNKFAAWAVNVTAGMFFRIAGQL
jgi:hypothetical protein